MSDEASGGESNSRDSRVRQTFGAGEGPQILGQMMAEGGAEVFGSDGEKVGDLKDQHDAEFTVGRGGLKRDLHLPVDKISEIVGGEAVNLEVPSDQVEDMGWTGTDAADKADEFSEAPIRQGLGEVLSGRKRERGVDKKDK